MSVSTTPRSAGLATELDANPSTPALTCDVLVVGAGPAGTAAAIELGRGGSHVVVVDKAVFPRDKCCGDGLTTLALRELEHLGLDPSTVTGWHDVSAAWLRSPSGREVELPLPTEGKFAAVAPRRELDDALVRLTRAAGIDVRDGSAFSGLSTATDSTTGDAIDLDIDGVGTVRAHYVIAADGMWSPVRKALGVNQPGYLGEWHAFRQYVNDVSGPAADRLYVWFEADLLPGYAWSFPLPGNRANVGFGVLRERSRRVGEMKDLWIDLLQRPHIVAALGPGFELEDRHTAWPIPARVDDVTLSHGRTMFVGDAAAATDVMTGEGIGQALLTGRLAAEAILAAGTADPAAARAAYESAVRHHLFADHTMSRVLGRVLRHPLGARGAIRVVAASGAWGRRNFARWMFEDEPRAVVLTPRRWHRRFLARPGAYRA
jgi:menaquinone-9 beta-reductase